MPRGTAAGYPPKQVDSSTTREYGGAGLGLTTTARLIKPMGGEIGVEKAMVGNSILIG